MSNYLDRYSFFMKLMIKIFRIPDEDRYGRRGVTFFANEYLKNVKEAVVVDIAAGSGSDLTNIRKDNAECDLKLFGLEAYLPNIKIMNSQGISTFAVDIEKERLPFEDKSVDIIIANQIFEHCKELWWITSELSRVLKKGGVAIIGVPNLASLHCRASLLFGKQPTCMETHGPHVRGFVFKDLKYFLEDGKYFNVIGWRGSGFYFIVPWLSNFWAKIFPNAAVCTVICAERTKNEGLFIDNLTKYRYETNYFDGGYNKNFIVSKEP